MSRSSLDRRRDFVVRQLARRIADGTDLDEAVEVLRAAASPATDAVLRDLEDELAGRARGTTVFAAGEHAVMEVVRAHAGDRLRAFTVIQQCRDAGVRSMRGFFLGLVDQGAYLAALVAVLALVYAVYAFLVFPSIETFYADLEAEVPWFQRVMLGRSVSGGVLLLTLAGAIGLAWRLALVIRAHIHDWRPLSDAWSRWPIAAPVVRHQRAWIQLQWLLVLVAAGIPHSEARDAVVGHSGALTIDAEVDDMLATAAKLGDMESELHEQVQIATANLLQAMERLRTVLMYALRLLIYAAIGLMVATMYMPLFGMGTAL